MYSFQSVCYSVVRNVFVFNIQRQQLDKVYHQQVHFVLIFPFTGQFYNKSVLDWLMVTVVIHYHPVTAQTHKINLITVNLNLVACLDLGYSQSHLQNLFFPKHPYQSYQHQDLSPIGRDQQHGW